MNDYNHIADELEKLSKEKLNLAFEKVKLENKTNAAKILYLIGIPSTFLSYTGISFITNPAMNLNELILSGILISSIILPVNLIANGTIITRKKKINKVNEKIMINNNNIDNLIKSNSIEKVNYKSKTEKTSIKPIDRSYEVSNNNSKTKKLEKY